jgi:Mg/Co/Ni transporter MgtE
MTTALRWRKFAQSSNPVELEEGGVNSESGGSLISKLTYLQNKNMELENTVLQLKSQIDVMKTKSKLLSEDNSDVDIVPPTTMTSFLKCVYDRASLLLLLLVVQSFSSIILGKYEMLLSKHPVLIYFLTMLIGAGGNAGNQAAVRVIRGIALGLLNSKTRNGYLLGEFKIGMALSILLGFAGFIRTIISSRAYFAETLTITVTLMIITFVSIIIGSILPFILEYLKLDPAHSSTTIQVIMDISGVLLTCLIAQLLL